MAMNAYNIYNDDTRSSLQNALSVQTLPGLPMINNKSRKEHKKSSKSKPFQLSSLDSDYNMNKHYKNVLSEGGQSSSYLINNPSKKGAKDTIKLTKRFQDKFYEDVTKETLTKKKQKINFNDQKLSKQVLHLKKFTSFWRCFVDYASPVVTIAKYNVNKKNSQRNYGGQSSIEAGKYTQVETLGNDERKRIILKPILYTNSSICESNHKYKVERDKAFYERMKTIKKSLN